jgi:VWFA-related protein
MIRRFATVALLALTALVTATAAQQVFRSRIQGVVVSVWVRDGKRPVPRLSARDFQVRDNGVYQVLRDVSLDTLPLDVTLTIDLSGSMLPPQLDRITVAAGQLAAALQPSDRCRVVTFTDRVVERAPMASVSPTFDLRNRISGSTALFDATALTLVAVPDPNRRRLGIVLTDGGENSSFVDVATLLDAAKYSDVVLEFIIAPEPGGRGRRKSQTTWELQKHLTQETGGQIIRMEHDGGLGAAFLEALEDFRTSYMVRYVPDGVRREGWHEIKVNVVQPADASAYIVRARKGYFGD